MQKPIINALLDSTSIAEAFNNVNEMPFCPRYAKACQILALLANQQLNQEKNKLKPDFEDLKLQQVRQKFNEEMTEFWDEVKNGNRKINFERTFAELGDVAACVVGFLVALMQIKNNMVQ